MFIIVFFPNSDSELKGSTSGQKIGTEDTTGARGAVPYKLPYKLIFTCKNAVIIDGTLKNS